MYLACPSDCSTSAQAFLAPSCRPDANATDANATERTPPVALRRTALKWPIGADWAADLDARQVQLGRLYRHVGWEAPDASAPGVLLESSRAKVLFHIVGGCPRENRFPCQLPSHHGRRTFENATSSVSLTHPPKLHVYGDGQCRIARH